MQAATLPTLAQTLAGSGAAIAADPIATIVMPAVGVTAVATNELPLEGVRHKPRRGYGSVPSTTMPFQTNCNAGCSAAGGLGSTAIALRARGL
jgi:hypothetical protein